MDKVFAADGTYPFVLIFLVFLGSRDLREGEAIYLWLRIPEVEELRYYVLPWDQKLARQLHRAQREATAQGTAVRAKHLFSPGQDRQAPVFYAQPQLANPPKQPPAHDPLVFESAPRL